MPSTPAGYRPLVLLLCGVASLGATLNLRANTPFLSRSAPTADLTYAVAAVMTAVVVYTLTLLVGTLALGASERPHVRRLTFLLSFWALAAGRYGFDPDVDGRTHLWVELATCVIGGLLVFTMIRFAQTFPSPVRVADFTGWKPCEPAEGTAPRRARSAGSRAASTLCAAARLLLRPGALRVTAAAAALGTALLATWSDKVMYPVRNLVIVGAVLLSAVYLFVSYQTAERAGRRRILWLLLSAVLVLPVVILVVADAIAMWTEADPFFSYLVFIGYGIFMLASVLCLMIGVYGQGAMDPRLYLRRSITFALLSLPALVLWVVIEGGASAGIAKALNLRENSVWTVAVCGVLATALTAPLKKPTEAWVKRKGQSLLADEEESAPVVLAFACFAGKAPRALPVEGYSWAQILAQAAADTAAHHGADVLLREDTGVLLAFRDPENVLPGTQELRNSFQRGIGALSIPPHPLRIGLYVHHAQPGTATSASLLENVRRVALLAGAGEIVGTEAAVSELVRQTESAWEPAGEVAWEDAPVSATCFRFRTPA